MADRWARYSLEGLALARRPHFHLLSSRTCLSPLDKLAQVVNIESDSAAKSHRAEFTGCLHRPERSGRNAQQFSGSARIDQHWGRSR
jgi:hypothetical protein